MYHKDSSFRELCPIIFVRGFRTRIRKKHRTGAGWPVMKVGVPLVVPIHVVLMVCRWESGRHWLRASSAVLRCFDVWSIERVALNRGAWG